MTLSLGKTSGALDRRQYADFVLTKKSVVIRIIGSFGGEVPERPKGSDCKSDAKASLVRIQPSPPVNDLAVSWVPRA